ncbi:MAG TPA: efflux RND transporter permease subunit [Nannocystis exedens]|nr:efflux RND transporter permease subunit [Nannocystis exedens]
MILRGRRPKEQVDRSLWWQRIFRRETAFDAVFLAAGMALLVVGRPLAGWVVIGIASLRLTEPFLPSRFRAAAPLAANGLTIAAVTLALTDYWLPLGPGESYGMNLGFVVLTVAVLMGGFTIFQHSYRPLLRWCLAHKVIFLGANVAFILLGATAWLGSPTTFGWLRDPEVTEDEKKKEHKAGDSTDSGESSEPSESEKSEKSEKSDESSPPREPSLLAKWTGPTLDALDRAMPGLKSDFMPPFDEGAFLFMPTTTPHASIGQSIDLLQAVDAAIAEIPEVTSVVGKLGRAESPLDPAPIMMMETVINYRPEYRRVHHGRIGRFRYDEERSEYVRDSEGELIEDDDGRPYRDWREHITSVDGIWDEITRVAKYPGLTGAPKLMPIKTRIVMLQTGMRSAVGMKILGPDLATIEGFGLKVEALLKTMDEVNKDTVLADRIVGKPYLELDINRDAISRYGLTINDVQNVIQIAIGGKMLTRTVEGRERYPVRVRYMREERDDVEALRRVMVPGRGGEQVPLEQLVEIRYVRGPQMIRSEDTFLNGYVTWDPAEGVGEVESVEAAREFLDAKIASGELVVPAGVSYRFAGTYENQQRSQARLSVLVPIALMVIFMLLYLQFRRTSTALMVFSGMLLAAAGGFILIWLYGQDFFLNSAPFGIELRQLFQVGGLKMTVAVWVGFLALFGVATDNGVIVATYLTQSFRDAGALSVEEIRARVVEAGHRRVRPCLMTTATTLLALLPVITSQGRGSDLMIPMALPTVGGVVLTLVTLVTVPVLFSAAREFEAWRARHMHVQD